jgi:phasin
MGKPAANKRIANPSVARPAASAAKTAHGISMSDVAPKQGSADVRVAAPVAPESMVTQVPEGRSAQRAEPAKAALPVQKDAAAAPAAPERDSAPRVAARPSAPAVSTPESPTPTAASAVPTGISSPEAAASVDQAREAFASMRSSADTLTGSLGTSRDAAAKGMQDFATTLIDAMHTQLAATLDYFKALATVRTLSEAIELQSSHARQQFETVTDHAKALAKIATRTATDAAAPVGNVLDGTRKRSS